MNISNLALQIETLAHALDAYERKILGSGELGKLSPAQIDCLARIYKMETPTVSELAREMRITKPSVTATVERLEKAGLLEKEQSAEDRRVQRLILTKKGLKLASDHKAVHYKFVRDYFKNLEAPDISRLCELLEKA